MNVINLFLVTFVSVVFFSIQAEAQKNAAISDSSQKSNWFTFSPPDKSFTVELPENPVHTNSLDLVDPGDNDKDLFQYSKTLDVYHLNLNSQPDSFGIAVFDVSGYERNSKRFVDESELISEVLGGDHKTVIKNSNTYVRNLPARDLVYYNGEYGRILMINAGSRIFVLSYTSNTKNLSKDAKRIFRSFKPRLIK